MPTTKTETENTTIQKTTKNRKTTTVVPFVVEMADPRCNDIVIQCIPGCKLRSAIKSVKKVFSPHKGDETTFAHSGVVPGLPELPGMQVHVFPSTGKYKITDPLHGDERTCNIIKSLLKKQLGFRTAEKLDGSPPVSGKLDPSTMKTLVRELVRLVEGDMAVVIKGERPTEQEMENLPGRYLLNPGSRVPTGQPRYEDELEDYVDNLRRVGG